MKLLLEAMVLPLALGTSAYGSSSEQPQNELGPFNGIQSVLIYDQDHAANGDSKLLGINKQNVTLLTNASNAQEQKTKPQIDYGPFSSIYGITWGLGQTNNGILTLSHDEDVKLSTDFPEDHAQKRDALMELASKLLAEKVLPIQTYDLDYTKFGPFDNVNSVIMSNPDGSNPQFMGVNNQTFYLFSKARAQLIDQASSGDSEAFTSVEGLLWGNQKNPPFSGLLLTTNLMEATIWSISRVRISFLRINLYFSCAFGQL